MPPQHQSPQSPAPTRSPLAASVSFNQHVSPEPAVKQQTPLLYTGKRKDIPFLQQSQPRKTNAVVWCAAVVCLIFSLVLIFFGIATLIIYLVVRPRNPVIDMPNASLNAIYFDSPEYFNGDFTFLANFSNPNQKIGVRYEYLDMGLFFNDKLISTQAVQPFSQRPGEARLQSVHFISSLVYLPQNLGVELRKQVMSNRVVYSVRGTFRVRASFGLIHYSYWLHSRCQLEMTGPPIGVLVARRCKTSR